MTNEARGWTAAEEQTLKELYGKVPANDIAEMMGRTELSVRGKARYMGLKSELRNHWEAKAND